MAAALTAMVGLSLLERTGGGRTGAQPPVGEPTLSPTGSSVARQSPAPTSRSLATARPTTARNPVRGTPLPRLSIPVGPTLVCPPGSTPNQLGPSDQDRPATDMPRMAFDRESGSIILLVTGPDAWETWAFDVCANRWHRMRPSRQPGSDEGAWWWIQLVYDADSDLTIGAFPDGSIWAYDDVANSWTEHGDAPVGGPLRLVYDPVSGLVVVQPIDSWISELWTYDVETNTWTSITQSDAPTLGLDRDHELLAYDGSVDRVIAYNAVSYGTRLLDLRTGTWAGSATRTPVVNTGFFATGGEIAYDEAREQTVVFSDGLVIAYRARADRWEVLDGRPGSFPVGISARIGHWMVYDSTNSRLVVYGPQRTDAGWIGEDDLVGFDPVKREWTVLLDAGDERPLLP